MTYNTSASPIKHTKEEEEGRQAGRKKTNKPSKQKEDGGSRLGGREEAKILTSLGLFFAVATPVKPTEKREEGYRRTFQR